MRAATVSDVHIESSWIMAAQAVVVAIVGGAALWLAQRLVGKAAWKTALDKQANGLIDQLQEERKEYLSIIKSERVAHDEMVKTLRSDWDIERLAASAERAQLRGEILNLTQTIESLKSQLRREHVKIDPEIHRVDAGTAIGHPMTVLEQTFPVDEDGN